MFYYILFIEIFILSVIIADPDPPILDLDSDKSPQLSYNPYGYRQGQLQTPSPYLNKRNPDSNTYSNPEQSQSSAAAAASPYGNLPTRSAANQCKLHINCPSKKIKFYSNIKELFLDARNRVTLDIQGPAGMYFFLKR
jgi:hypothetical protein